MNPKAVHIWGYLESCFICTNNVDAIRKLSVSDVGVFKDMHNVYGPNDLPTPEGLDYIQSFESAVLKDNFEQWIASFEPKTDN